MRQMGLLESGRTHHRCGCLLCPHCWPSYAQVTEVVPSCPTPAASAAACQPYLEGDQILGHFAFVLPALLNNFGTFQAF